MSSTTKLLPCPFCSNADISIKNENPKDNSGGYFIECPGCGASTALRFACGDDPTHLLAEQWNHRTASHCLHQIQEPEADIWPCVNIDVDESGNITNAKLYSPGLPAGNHDVYPHTGKPRDERDIASDPEGKLIVAPGPLFAAAAPVALPEPAYTLRVRGVFQDVTPAVNAFGLPDGEYKLFTEPQVLTKLATATGLPAQADMPDSFREWFAKNYPADTIIVDPDWHAKSIFRMALAHARLAAPQAQADARDAESDYQRGYRHGYNRRDAEVQGALL